MIRYDLFSLYTSTHIYIYMYIYICRQMDGENDDNLSRLSPEAYVTYLDGNIHPLSGGGRHHRCLMMHRMGGGHLMHRALSVH